MPRDRRSLRSWRNQLVNRADRWVKEVMEHLENVYKAALNSEFHAESMIVLEIEELLDVCYTMPEEDFNIRHSFLLLLKYTILSNNMSIFDRCTDIINNFQGEKELASALLDFLAVLAIPQIQIFTLIDENIQRLFSNPGARYREEFVIYYYTEEENEEDKSEEEECDIEREDFNENYQELAPSKESQLERLKNELAITLCEECQMPTKNQECDCWILEIEGY
jgi:hypothetical protein